MPFIVALLSDDHSATVRAAAVRALTDVLSFVQRPTLGMLFTEYLLPAIERVNRDSERMVRLAFSECLPQLIGTGRRFLETARAIKLNCRPQLRAAAADGARDAAEGGAAETLPPLPPTADEVSGGEVAAQAECVSAWVDGARSWTVAELELESGSAPGAGDSFDKQLFEFNSRFEALLNPMLITGDRVRSSLAKVSVLYIPLHFTRIWLTI